MVAGFRLGFTNGCFDLLHYGHAKFLDECASRVNMLIVAMNTDEWIREHKGAHRPIIPEDQRKYMLEALLSVDIVVPFGEESDLDYLVSRFRPDVMFKGEDYRGKPVTGSHIVAGQGGRLEFIPLVDNMSTSYIEAKIINTHLQGRIESGGMALTPEAEAMRVLGDLAEVVSATDQPPVPRRT